MKEETLRLSRKGELFFFFFFLAFCPGGSGKGRVLLRVGGRGVYLIIKFFGLPFWGVFFFFFLLPFCQRSSAKGRVLQPVAAAGCFAVYTGAFGPAPADGCAPLIVLRGLASQPGGIFQSLAHIGPAVPAKVAALVQHGRRHLIPQTVGILSQLRFASGRKLTDICFVFLKNKSVLARRRRFFGR